MQSSISTKFFGLLSVILFCAQAGAVNEFPYVLTPKIDAGNIRVTGNTVSTLNTNGDLTIAPNGSGSTIFSTLAATTVPYLDGSKKLTSSSVTPTQLSLLASATNANTASTLVLRDGSGNFSAGIVTAALTGNADTATMWATPRNLANNSVDGSANVIFANKFVVQGTADAGLSAAQFLGALGTGIIKNTTTTGVLSIAVAADFPTLNQSTSGNAATATALASVPTACGANTYATTIAANGNLTCASITNASTTGVSTNTPSTLVLRDGSGNFAAGTMTGNVNATQIGLNDTSGTSAMFLKTSAVGTPTLTIKAITSQSADIMQVLDVSSVAQMIFTSGGNFKFFHNVTTPEARFDIRPSVNQSSANAGNNARYSMFIGDPQAPAANLGGGIAFGGPNTSSIDLTEYGYIWVNKNNLTSGDVGASMHFATRNNSTGNAQRSLELNSSGDADFFGTAVNINGSTSGKISVKAQAAAGTYNFNLPITAGSAGDVLTSQAGGSTAMTWTTLTAPSKQVFTSTGTQTGTFFGHPSLTFSAGDTYTDGSSHVFTALFNCAGCAQSHWSGTGYVSGVITRTTGVGTASFTPNANTALATYTKPANVKFIKITLVGPGGGGGGATSVASNCASACGGGAGGAAISYISSPASTYFYNVGVGGAGGANTGANGSSATFATTFNGFSIEGDPGTGGVGDAAVATAHVSPCSGTDQGGGSAGDVTIKGGSPTPAYCLSGLLGFGGFGANSGFGLGLGGTPVSGSVVGTGHGFGSGGGGGWSTNASGAKVGGAGANGVIIVEEYIQ